MPFAEAWIDLANVIYSEINQKENKVSYNIVYMWNLEKNGTNELICKEEKETQMQRTNLWIPTEEGGG